MQIATKPGPTENISSRIIGKQVDLLYDNQLTAILTTAVIVVLLFSFLTYSTERGNLIPWFSMFFVVILLRLFFNWRYLKNRKNRIVNIKRAEFIYIAGVVLTGVIWGMTGIWLFPELDFKGQVLLFIFVIAVAAAANSTMAYRKAPIYSFMLLLVLPLAIGVNTSNFPNAQVVSIAMLVGLVFLLRTATIFYNNTYRMLHFQEIFKDREHELLLQREKANLANMAKSDFLSRMSHELRTPLNAILGLNELQLADKKDPLTVKQNDRSKKIADAAKHLLSIVNDILDLSHIETGGMDITMELTDCQAVIQGSIKLVEGKASLRNITFFSEYPRPEPGVYVMADHKRLKQVIVNLLDNAVKYNKQDGTVSIILNIVENGYLRFSIFDTGQGIAADAINELFKPFSRLGAEESGIDGTGIGLSLCKQLVELMGGRIGVDSRPGEGSCFWIELQHVKQAGNYQPDEPSEPLPELLKTTNSAKILLVEDNLVNCEVAVDMLESLGFNVDTANNGQLALDLYHKNQYALILMDCEMPVMDGFVTTGQIKKIETEQQRFPTPIIALTAHATSGAREKCISSGMDDFLSKPFSMSALHSMLNKWLLISSTEVTGDLADNQNAGPYHNSNKDRIGSAILDYEVLNKLRVKQKKAGTDLVDRVISVYLEQSSSLLDDLMEAGRKADVEAVRVISHTLKSSSVNVGATGLSELCRKVEHHCEQGQIENSLVQQIHKNFSEVKKALIDVQNDVNN